MKRIILFTVIICLTSTVWADYENYDQIVEKLTRYSQKKQQKEVATSTETSNQFSQAHIGLGFMQTFYDANTPGSKNSIQNQGGLLLNVGIDIFSPQWAMEGSYANFGTQESNALRLALREYSLKVLHKPNMGGLWNLRLGAGFSSRFLDISQSNSNTRHQTPSALFTFGLESHLNSFMSIGADLNFKTAMISETIDKNSVDLAFRIDTHF